MDYKQKYEEALERARQVHITNVDEHKISTEYIFPELKESEDEKIRKKVIEVLKFNIDGAKSQMQASRGVDRTFEVYACNKVIAWLEKQGEQKETLCDKCRKEHPSHSCQDITELGRCAVEHEQKTNDKIEPKFKVGDWITIDNPCQIISIDRNYIVQYCDDEKTREISKKFCESQFHLWSIQDVKDGDILQLGLVTVIFNKFANNQQPNPHYCHCYCSCCHDEFEIPTKEDTYGFMGAQPATKEQRDLLFQKIKEAGYEWDAEKKELKKIEQKPADNIIEEEKPLLEKFKQAVYDCAWGKVTCKKEGETKEEYAERWAEQLLILVRDWADDYIDSREDAIRRRSFDEGKQSIQNPAWSEEDEEMYNQICNDIDYLSRFTDRCDTNLFNQKNNWLESLKQRMKGETK